MLTTVLFLALLCGHVALMFLIWAWSLRLGLRWGRVTGVTGAEVWGAIACLTVIHVLGIVFDRWVLRSDEQGIGVAIAMLLGGVVVDVLIISLVFQLEFGPALKVWLPTLSVPILSILSLVFLIRPFLYEPFLIPTNSMAPTILGAHTEGVCPECSGTTYLTPVDDRMESIGPEWQICDKFHVTTVMPRQRASLMRARGEIDAAITGDRIVVAKFLRPQRWDLVVFKYPGNPSEYYVKRLVGLPGETIHIEAGALFVDGVKQTPPPHLAGLEYLAEIPEVTWLTAWGTPHRPAVLGEGEYFMLGDFSSAAMDSRYWTEGAPGHPSYAVPESYLHGVVTHTAWPPKRWRVHR